MLARGAQDLADLRHQRLDAVADAALAELAEAGEVAADLGRVDVRVLGQLLRGDRLAAHLAGLDQHLQVAREAGGDAKREALAVDDQPVGRLLLFDHRRSRPHSIEPRPNRGLVEDQLGDHDRRRSRPPGSARAYVAAAARRSRCRPRAGRSGSPRRAGRRAPRSPLAEMAAGPGVDGRLERSCGRAPAGRLRGEGVAVEVARVGDRRREAGGGADHRRVVGAELAGDQLELDAAALAERRRPPRAAAPLAATPPPSATASHSPVFSARSSLATS